MAQTKRKRRTKHRGNAAGMVEVRGRTGRPGPGGSVSASGATGAKGARRDRYSQPPTWKGAMNRAGIATVLFIVVVIVVIRQPIASAVAIGAAMFALYVPIGYYTDNFVYQRRQKQLAAKGKV